LFLLPMISIVIPDSSWWSRFNVLDSHRRSAIDPRQQSLGK
jgi:hypothetical protein